MEGTGSCGEGRLVLINVSGIPDLDQDTIIHLLVVKRALYLHIICILWFWFNILHVATDVKISQNPPVQI